MTIGSKWRNLRIAASVRILTSNDHHLIMRAYFYDNIPGDQRLLHDSGESVDEATLKALGVLYWHIPLEGNEERIEDIARERDYKNRDIINVTKEGLGDQYEAKLKMFFAEYVCITFFLTLRLTCSLHFVSFALFLHPPSLSPSPFSRKKAFTRR